MNDDRTFVFYSGSGEESGIFLHTVMNKVCLFVNLLVGLLLAGAALGDQADNGLECTIKMEKTFFDVRDRLRDFTLVFTNKGKKSVRLYDDFYPEPTLGPRIKIELWSWQTGKKKKGALFSR